MTATINADATQLTIYSSQLTTAALTLTLNRKYGCSATVLPVTVTGKIATVNANSFTINLADIYPSTSPTKIEDGVHYFELKYSFNSGSGLVTFVTETFCLIADYDLKCKLIKNPDPLLLEKYEALFYNYDCDNCLCATSCKIFSDLLTELNLNPTSTNGDPGCGCN